MLPRLLRGLGREDAGRCARDARVRLARGPASRGTSGPSSPACARRGALRLPRHAQLRHRGRRGGGRRPAPVDPAGAPAARARQRRAPRGRGRAAAGVSLAKLVKALKLDPEKDVYTVDRHAQRRGPDAASSRADERATSATSRSSRTPSRRSATRTTSSPSSASRTSCCTTPTSRSTPSSTSSRAPPTIPTSSPSSRRSTAPAATRPSSRRSCARRRAASRSRPSSSSRPASTRSRTSSGRARSSRAGVHVVYGLLGLKTHAKCLLIVRREKGKLRRYVHLSTGNYNPSTARLYTDFSLFTCAPGHLRGRRRRLFNLLTGYSAPPKWNKLIVAPLGLHEAVLGLIAREAEHARAGTARAHRRQDERARRRRRHRGALPRLAGGRADHAARPRHLLPASRRARA